MDARSDISYIDIGLTKLYLAEVKPLLPADAKEAAQHYQDAEFDLNFANEVTTTEADVIQFTHQAQANLCKCLHVLADEDIKQQRDSNAVAKLDLLLKINDQDQSARIKRTRLMILMGKRAALAQADIDMAWQSIKAQSKECEDGATVYYASHIEVALWKVGKPDGISITGFIRSFMLINNYEVLQGVSAEIINLLFENKAPTAARLTVSQLHSFITKTVPASELQQRLWAVVALYRSKKDDDMTKVLLDLHRIVVTQQQPIKMDPEFVRDVKGHPFISGFPELQQKLKLYMLGVDNNQKLKQPFLVPEAKASDNNYSQIQPHFSDVVQIEVSQGLDCERAGDYAGFYTHFEEAARIVRVEQVTQVIANHGVDAGLLKCAVQYKYAGALPGNPKNHDLCKDVRDLLVLPPFHVINSLQISENAKLKIMIWLIRVIAAELEQVSFKAMGIHPVQGMESIREWNDISLESKFQIWFYLYPSTFKSDDGLGMEGVKELLTELCSCEENTLSVATSETLCRLLLKCEFNYEVYVTLSTQHLTPLRNVVYQIQDPALRLAVSEEIFLGRGLLGAVFQRDAELASAVKPGFFTRDKMADRRDKMSALRNELLEAKRNQSKVESDGVASLAKRDPILAYKLKKRASILDVPQPQTLLEKYDDAMSVSAKRVLLEALINQPEEDKAPVTIKHSDKLVKLICSLEFDDLAQQACWQVVAGESSLAKCIKNKDKPKIIEHLQNICFEVVMDDATRTHLQAHPEKLVGVPEGLREAFTLANAIQASRPGLS